MAADIQTEQINILEDLSKRNLKVAAFVCEDKDGKLLVISYDENGLVKFISETATNISINERLEGRMVRPMADIGRGVKS